MIGTGPYRLAEWIPDKHVHLERFAQYTPGPGDPSGYAGRRLACVEHIYFLPVPEVSSRVAGLESGDYDYGQNLPAEAYTRLTGTKGLKTVILKPYYEIVMHLNTQNGALREWKLRRAIQMGLNEDEIMLSAAGDKTLYRLDPSLFFKEQYWHSNIGANRYNEHDVAKAKALVKEGGYDGSPLRIITTSDFQFIYNAALAMESQLRQLGFTTKVQAYDYPTMIDIFRKKRGDWDISYNAFSIRTDPGGFTFVLKSESGYQPYASKDVDALLEKGRATCHQSERVGRARPQGARQALRADPGHPVPRHPDDQARRAVRLRRAPEPPPGLRALLHDPALLERLEQGQTLSE